MDNKRVHLKEDIRDPCGVNVKKGGSASRKMLCIFLSGNILGKFPCHPHRSGWGLPAPPPSPPQVNMYLSFFDMGRFSKDRIFVHRNL